VRVAPIIFLGVLAAAAAAAAPTPSLDASLTPPQSRGSVAAQHTALRYDADYPVIGYSGKPTHNAIARLQEQLDRGEVKLEFAAPRGYLDSILKHLGIDPSSQTLVYSKTSLQIDFINAATPRAIYFNDDTYVAWVQKSGLLEFVTADSALGPVFYSLDNHPGARTQFDRETLRCLACHDKFSLQGGGVPQFLVMSSLVDVNGLMLGREVSTEVTDQTPIQARWAGWYVTGHSGKQIHLGNILVHSPQEIAHLDRARLSNLDTLDGLLDVKPYPTNTSDVVALLVLEHQITIHNLLTRLNFKARTFMDRAGKTATSWEDVPQELRVPLERLAEPLVQAMLFVDAAPITDKISGNQRFRTWFESQGPRDPAGRSLRELDLTHRLFKYPLSYLVYSEGFDGLPDYARSYIYQRFAQILSGEDQSAAFAHLSASDRKALMQILEATKPEFTRMAHLAPAAADPQG
jgi:hypothetical protein